MTHSAGTSAPPSPFGYWVPSDSAAPSTSPADFRAAIADLRSPVAVVRTNTGFAIARGGTIGPGTPPARESLPVAAYLPPLAPEQLGDPDVPPRPRAEVPVHDRGDGQRHRVGRDRRGDGPGRACSGSSARPGCRSTASRRPSTGCRRTSATRRSAVNLIHSPNEPAHEAATADLLLAKRRAARRGVAYLDLTPPVVRYRVAGFGRARAACRRTA